MGIAELLSVTYSTYAQSFIFFNLMLIDKSEYCKAINGNDNPLNLENQNFNGILKYIRFFVFYQM